MSVVTGKIRVNNKYICQQTTCQVLTGRKNTDESCTAPQLGHVDHDMITASQGLLSSCTSFT
jgi:hypothetical protein